MAETDENTGLHLEEEQDRKGDPNSKRLLERVLDRIDLVLTQHGMGFREEHEWSDFAAEVQAVCYKYYDDFTGGDSSYNPDDDSSMRDEEVEEEEGSSESKSATLDESSDEAEESRATKRRK